MDKDIHDNTSDDAACPEWLEGDKKLLKGITAVFIKNVPGQMERLRDALQSNDAALVEILSHSLKGSASMIGAHPLRDAALRVERAAIEGDLEKARSLYPDMDAELKNVIASLSKI
jgi:HPt (histidine-containing phosphotransfer) domain-containing protein